MPNVRNPMFINSEIGSEGTRPLRWTLVGSFRGRQRKTMMRVGSEPKLSPNVNQNHLVLNHSTRAIHAVFGCFRSVSGPVAPIPRWRLWCVVSRLSVENIISVGLVVCMWYLRDARDVRHVIVLRVIGAAAELWERWTNPLFSAPPSPHLIHWVHPADVIINKIDNRVPSFRCA